MFQSLIKCIAYIFVSVLNMIFSVPLLGRSVDLVLTFLATVVRLGAGNYVANNIRECKRPKKMLQLYEYEGCPFCRRVRETLTILDLDAEIFPTPRETFKKYGFIDKSRFRPIVLKKGGKSQFPFLIDPNTGVAMYESSDIIQYLWKEYGSKAAPFLFDRLGSLPILNLGVFVASAFRVSSSMCSPNPLQSSQL